MNKFMKKIMSKKDGFTLVELIVVIAILAILAGIAIPAYSGYLKSANKAADITALSAVKTAAMATYATVGNVTQITVTDDATDSISVQVNGAAHNMTDAEKATLNGYLNSNAFSIVLKTGKSATWTAASGEWTISGTPYTA